MTDYKYVSATPIEIPHDALVILMGPAGAGKSFFAARYFSNSEIVSSDGCRALVCDDETEQRYNDLAFAVFHEIIRARLKIGVLTVADATNLTKEARQTLRGIAKEFKRPVVLLQFVTSKHHALDQNASRQRKVPERVIDKHYLTMEQNVKLLEREGYDALYQVTPQNYYDIVRVDNRNVVMGSGFDVIGDVHGCWDELSRLIFALGYKGSHDELGDYRIRHPEGRKLVFVGDFTDRGPHNVEVLRAVSEMVSNGDAFAVGGNHDRKLERWMRGNPVRISHGLDITIRQIEAYCTLEERSELHGFLKELPYQLRLRVRGAPDLIVAHAGITYQSVGKDTEKARAECNFGVVNGFDEKGRPNRDLEGFITTWDGVPEYFVFGHVIQKTIEWRGQTIGIDGGCVGGKDLVALSWPERTITKQPALNTYYEMDW